VYNNEVIIDKVKLDSNSPPKTWVAACESLGVSGRGGKAGCLKRLWDHLQAQELIAAPLAQHQLRGDLARPVYFQPTPAEPTEKEIADHNLAHQPFAPRSELCIANRSQQDGHPARQDEPAGAHTCVSLDFGSASRTEHEQKVCNFLFTIIIQVWFQHLGQEDVIYSLFALNLVGSWFGLGSPLLPFDVIDTFFA
jgi:hypothetical protein